MASRQLSCRECCKRIGDAPFVYPEGPSNVSANLSQSIDPEKLQCLYHDKQVNIVSTAFFPNEGANMVFLGESTYLSFTTQPETLNSELFKFRFRKYPDIEGAVRDDSGRVTYQSGGQCIREGDNVTMDNVAHPSVLTHSGFVSPYNIPFVNVPYRDALDNFEYMGTKAYENIRIISKDFNPTIPLNDQPVVKLDGSKQYFIQFTRTGQFLSLVPGLLPAPYLIKTSGYMGANTAFVFLDPTFVFTSRADALRQQQIAKQQAAAAAAATAAASAGK
jgi:hypothetical protein